MLPNEVNVIIAFTSPFQLVFRDEHDRWSPTLDEVKLNAYDHAKLHRISASLDIGLPHPLCLHFAFDGSLIIRKMQDYWETVARLPGPIRDLAREIPGEHGSGPRAMTFGLPPVRLVVNFRASAMGIKPKSPGSVATVSLLAS